MAFLAVSALIFGAGAAGAAYFYPFVTPEMVEHSRREQARKVAALTPMQRLWYAAMQDWKDNEARKKREAEHALYEEMDQLLAADIRELGYAH